MTQCHASPIGLPNPRKAAQNADGLATGGGVDCAQLGEDGRHDREFVDLPTVWAKEMVGSEFADKESKCDCEASTPISVGIGEALMRPQVQRTEEGVAADGRIAAIAPLTW